MEYRQLGHSGLKVSALSFGTATFGGTNEFFKSAGQIGVEEATRLVDLCMEAGINLFDTADFYSGGDAERILGAALKGRRNDVLVSSKFGLPMGPGPNDSGASRHHIIRACEASLERLGTDYIDLYMVHAYDPATPAEETLRALDDLISAGKVRYIGVSNYSGWQLMKALAISDREGLARYVVYQGYYSLLGRHYEWELEPLGADQGVSLMVWSPLGWGRLTGKIRRGQPVGAGRIEAGMIAGGPPVADEHLFKIIDALDDVAGEVGKSIPQIALNWLLGRRPVANVIIGARNEGQLRDNLGCTGWTLDADQLARLDAASAEVPIYPYWHQRMWEN